MRGSNDLVWVGRAANIAAKLCSIREAGYPSWISESVFNALGKDVKYASDGVTNMWGKRVWKPQAMVVYRSGYYWAAS